MTRFKALETFKEGENTATISLIIVAILGVSKAIIGFFSASISLLTQAIDSLTDVFGLVAVFLGMRLSRRPPSKRFPYGYYRIETIVSLMIAILILITGVIVMRESVFRVFDPQMVTTHLYVIGVTVVSIPILYGLSRYVKNVGERIRSQSLLNQAEDFRVDIFTSVLVLVGVISGQLGFLWIEGIIGILISGFILKVGATAGWDALLILMDAVTHPEQMEQIKEIAEGTPGVKKVSRVRMRRSGPFCFGVLTVGIDRRVPVEQAHRVSNEIEQRVKTTFPFVESLMIHMEPQQEDTLRIAIPVVDDQGLASKTTGHFGEAPYFLFIDVEQGAIQQWTTTQNPSLELKKKRGITIANLLLEEEITTVLATRIGEGPFHYLRDSFIELYQITEDIPVSQALTQLLDGQLPSIQSATIGAKQEKKALNNTHS